MRRLLAARRVHGADNPVVRARVAVLPCVIRESAEPEAFADALVENLVRQDLTRREVMDAVATLRQHYGWGAREIARRTGRDDKDISELLRVAADAAVAPLVADELITATAAGTLVERRNLGVRAPVLEGIRAGRLRTTAQIDAALARARLQAEEAAAHASGLAARVSDAPSLLTEVGLSPSIEIVVPAPAAGGQTAASGGDEHANPEGTPVQAHLRRPGASSRAEALARDIITFAAEQPLLDRAALLKLGEARVALDALLAAGPGRRRTTRPE